MHLGCVGSGVDLGSEDHEEVLDNEAGLVDDEVGLDNVAEIEVDCYSH